MARSERDLRDRVRERAVALDQLQPGWAEGMGLDPDLAHFVQVLSSVTDADPFGERAEPIAAALADDGVAGSRLLARLHERAPELTAGPLDRERQFWVATGRTVVAAPDESLVQPVSADAASKPRDFGLFTSTGALGSLGMWACYLELHRHSTLFPGPRTAWSLPVSPQARVEEVASAADWVALVQRHPHEHGGLVHLDWEAVSAEVDGVHLTARAVAAVQGWKLDSAASIVAPSFWDVETTVWLRWAFEDARRAPQGPPRDLIER